MADIIDMPVEDLWRRLFRTQVGAARCHSLVHGKRVTLDRQFVCDAESLEISFAVHWAWLLPTWQPPALQVVCTSDDGRELATGTFTAGSFRKTEVRLAIAPDGVTLGQQLQIQVTRLPRCEEVGKLTFACTTPTAAIRAIQVVASQVLAVHDEERIVCNRLHDGITELGFNLSLRLADASARALLTQLGVVVCAAIHRDDASDWSARLSERAIRFNRSDFDWSHTTALTGIQLPQVPGNYQLQIRVADELVNTQGFAIVPLRAAIAEVQAMVRERSELTSVTCSAVNHHAVAVPLGVVAEDFAALDVSITLVVPQPNPLVSETRHSIDLVMSRDGREMCRKHRRVAIKPGRQRFTLSQALSPELFSDGPGIYHLAVRLDDRVLHVATFEHKTRAQLKQAQAESILKSLRLSEPRLFSLRDSTRVESSDVFVTDDALVPAFTISGDGFDEDAPALQWRLNLCWRHLDSGEEFEEHRTLVAKAGHNRCGDIELLLHRSKRSFSPGRYTLELRKRDTLLHSFPFRILSVEEIIPYTQQQILRSLRVDHCRLLVDTGNLVYESAHVPDFAAGILPEFTLYATGFNRHVPSLPTELRLLLDRDGDRVELGSIGATLTASPFNFGNIRIKVRDGSVGASSGKATLLVVAGDAEIASFPFHVVTRDDILEGISVSAVRVEVQDTNEGRARMVSHLDIREHRAISIHLDIRTRVPAPGVEFAACILLRTAQRPLGQATFDLIPAQSLMTFRCRPIPLAKLGLKETSTQQRLWVEILIGGETKGSISIPIHIGQRLTDFEGQLTIDPSSLHVDDAEYEEILRKL